MWKFCRDSRKLCLSTKFPYQEIRSNHGIFRSVCIATTETSKNIKKRTISKMFNIDSTVKICNTKPSKILVLMLTVSIIFKKPSCMIMFILFFGKKIPNKWSNKDQIQPHNKIIILVSVQNFQNECSKCLGFLRKWL